jgi:hypothetical protein
VSCLTALHCTEHRNVAAVAPLTHMLRSDFRSRKFSGPLTPCIAPPARSRMYYHCSYRMFSESGVVPANSRLSMIWNFEDSLKNIISLSSSRQLNLIMRVLSRGVCGFPYFEKIK